MNQKTSASDAAGIGRAVAISNLTKRYGDFHAVNDLSLSVEAGEFLTILGPSGSGKTTTMMAIAGFVSEYDGTIAIGGRAIDHLPTHRRNIGVVFQHLALFPHMTVADNIAFPLHMRGVDKEEIRDKVARALDLVRLSGMQDRLPSQLSGGQQQRVALARALVFSPPVLLLDEPFGALDRKLREALQLEVRELHKKLGITIILVTHDQVEAITMSDRIAVMNHGRLVQVATPSQLYFSPANRFVAEFVGDSVFLPGRVTEVGDGICRIRTGSDALVSARCGKDIAPGSEVDILVRPEHFLLGDPKAENVQKATVNDEIFVGSRIMLDIALADGTRVLAETDNRNATLRGARQAETSVGWATADALALPR